MLNAPLPAPNMSHPLPMPFHFSAYSPQYNTLHILPFLSSLVSVSNTNILTTQEQQFLLILITAITSVPRIVLETK